MELVLQFDEQWLKEQLSAGVRVTRKIERWIAGRADASLKRSHGNVLVVELPSEDSAPAFVADLERTVAEDFHASSPKSVFSYRAVGQAAGQPTEPPPPDSSPDSSSSPSNERATSAPESKAEKTPTSPASGGSPSAEDVLSRAAEQVPFRYCPDLTAFLRETADVVPVLRRMDALSSFWNQHVLLSMADGYGLTNFLHTLHALYVSLDLVKPRPADKACTELKILVGPNEHERFRDWENAVDVARDMARANERNNAGRAILCLDIGAWQDSLATSAVKSFLRRLNAAAGSFTIVFRLPFVDARCLSSVRMALTDILNVRPLVAPPVPLSDLTEYAKSKLAQHAFSMDADAFPAFERWILGEKSDDSFFGYRTIDKMVDRLVYDKALANARSGKDGLDRHVAPADLAAYSDTPAEDGDPEAELEALVGLGEVKAKIREIVNQIKFQREMTAKGRTVGRPAIHMMFTGNPGTGKTTVARLVARILKKEGILRKGHLLEVKGRDFCGEYIGTTAPKTSAICRDAYGSVLFIDEAYSLFRGDRSDPLNRDYGPEALDTLVAEMENHRDDLCVIMAGYTDEMAEMLSGNIGMRDRIPFTVEFPNYGRDDLVRIFSFMARNSFECDPSLEPALRQFFDSIPDDVFRSKEFSNARFVRNLYERTWAKAACRARLADGGNDIRLLASDLKGAAQDREFKRLVERNTRQSVPIGFAARPAPGKNAPSSP